MKNKQKLEVVASYMRECATDPVGDGEAWFTDLMAALAEWLEIESQRHISLGALDSGYESVNAWEASWLDKEQQELEPCIRVANIFLDNAMPVEAEIVPAVTS